MTTATMVSPRSSSRSRRQGRRLGFAVFGCGHWGVNHIRVIAESPRTRIVAVCDAREERLAPIRSRFPEIRTTTSVEEAIGADGIDAVVVCTDATSHFELTGHCLSRGLHVLVEKPLTTTSVDALRLRKRAESAGRTLMVGHTFVYNAGVRKMKEYIDSAEIGQVYYVYARRTNLGPIRDDVNALWDLAPHDVSIFNFLLDDAPEWVSAVGHRVLNGREDVGFVSLGYPNDILAHIHVSWVEPNKVREVVVVGSEKRVVFNDLDRLEQVRVYEKGVALPESPQPILDSAGLVVRDGDIIIPKIDDVEPLKAQLEHFVDCVTTGLPPLTGGPEGLAVVRTMEAIDRSVAQNGKPVAVGR